MHISKLSANVSSELSILVVPFLSLFLLALLMSTNSIGSSGIILVLIWILCRESEIRNHWWKVLSPWLIAVFIYFLAMTTYGFSKITTLRDGLEVLKGIALSLVALYLLQLSDQQIRRVVGYVVFVLTVVTIGMLGFNLNQHSVAQFIDNQMFDWYVNRNRLAVGFSITSVFIAALMVDERTRWKSFLLSVAWILLASAALLNGSRGATMGMIAATICIILAGLFRVGWRQVFRLEVWLIPILIVLAGLGWVLYKHISFNQYLMHDGKGVDTGRFEIWSGVGHRIIQAPWFGYGSHAMKFDPMVAAIRTKFGITHPHSIYVGLVYASGIIGVLFWLLWFTSFSYKIRQNFTTNNKLAYYIGVGLLVNILVHGFVDFDLYMFAIFSYITVGLVMMLSKKSHEGSRV